MGQRGRPKHPDLLTPREQDVLALLRDNLTNEQIAERLGISFETAKHHVAEILSKLGVSTREQAAAWREAPGWSFGRVLLVIGGTGVVAAALAGLALLSWGLSRSGADESETLSLTATASPTATAPIVSPSLTTTNGVTEPNLLFRSFWMADAQRGWIGGQTRACSDQSPGCAGVIYRTDDGGDTWQPQYNGLVQVAEIAFQASGRGFAVGPTGACDFATCGIAILRTNDGGLHWDEILHTHGQTAHLAVSADDAWVLNQTCDPGRSGAGCTWDLRTTSDGGDTWTVSNLSDGFALNITRPTVDDAWIVMSPTGPGTSEIMATHDGGQTWQTLPSPENGAGFEEQIFFHSATQGWLVVAGQPSAGFEPKEIFSTTDGGETWTHLSGSLAPPSGTPSRIELPPNGYLGPIVFTSEVDGWIASPRLGLLRSSDGGKTWQSTLQNDNLQSIQFTDFDHGWALSPIALYRTTDAGINWIALNIPPEADVEG